ncbi:MAG: hypothetical protein AB1758_00370 [Candidatus Eremiobacterota bacterium]
MEPRRKVPIHLVVILAVAVLLGLAVAIHSNAPPQPASVPVGPGPEDRTIVAGLRVDLVTLGMPARAVEKRWGQATMRPTESSLIYRFDSLGVTLGVRDDKVESILVKNPALRTRGGVGVGSDVDQVIREFGTRYEFEGDPKSAYKLQYWDKGIHFTVEKDNVASILITQPVLGP